MTIHYSDGKAIEAVLLTRTENTLRVAVEGAEDVMEFTQFGETWVSADCEAVKIEFAWERRERKPTVTEADCLCSQELAGRLLRMLFTDSSEDQVAVNAPAELNPMAARCS